MAYNYEADADYRTIGWDATCGSGLLHSGLRRSARWDLYATSELEKSKAYLKRKACEINNIHFVAAAFDSFSAFGEEITAIIIAGFKHKHAKAKTDIEKHEISLERDQLIARISTAVQQKNATIFFANAKPLLGGLLPTATITPNTDLGRDFSSRRNP
jgi:hypothetical protein